MIEQDMNEQHQHKTLEQIENDYWGEPEYDSHLVTTVRRLRKKPIVDFEIEDLRIMIGQNRGLDILIPIAIAKLGENILAEGDLYKGDLLKSVLTVNPEYWQKQPDLKEQLSLLFQKYIDLFNDPDLIRKTRLKIFEAYNTFLVS